jgi:hypothetical protein
MYKFYTMSKLSLVLHTVLLLLPLPVHSQIGTMTQDISTNPAYSRQLPCAQSCFMYGVSCPFDNLGKQLGCEVQNSCNTRGWQAKNDCYCRPDLQQPAHQWLTSCIQSACSVGDAAIDASTAGSIYARYCAEKGYPSGPLPATVQATLTASDGTVSTSTRVFNAAPAATSGTGSGTTSSSSKSSSLPLTTIIGIVAGGLAGLVLLSIATKVLMNLCGYNKPRKPAAYPQQQQVPVSDTKGAVYPMHPYNEPYYPPPRIEDDIRPDDSFSVAGGLAQPAPTLASHGGSARRW